MRHRSGSVVDVELLRPWDWAERNGLRVGAVINLRLTEIDVDATGYVLSIADGPGVQPGEGAVVTGRFTTRRGSGLVRVTFEDGTRLVGSAKHPVWSPVDGAWRGLGEFGPGDFVQARTGLLAVTARERLHDEVPLCNIEVHGQHVYEVTDQGVLVHNSGTLCEELLSLRTAASNGALTAEQSARLAELEAQAAENAPTGTALARQLGQEGEQAVGITGPKVGIEMPSGVTRFPDQFDAATNVLDEVKNVQSQSYTQQLRDYTAFTQQNGGTFNLWVRPSTQLSGPLQQAINDGLINLKYIPGAK